MTLQQLSEQLTRETQDLVGQRGLVAGTTTQCFEVFIPATIRDMFERVSVWLGGALAMH